MATDREAAFPVEDFMGVNRQVDREDLGPNQFYSLQNLWEKKLGVLETRGGSKQVTPDFPSGIVGLDEIHRVYKSENSQERVVAAQMTRDEQEILTLPDSIAISFTDTGGNWNINNANPDVITGGESIILRFIGYGVCYYHRQEITSVSGYSFGANQVLNVDIPSGISDPNITGVEVYCTVKNGTNFFKTGDSNYNEMTLWLGQIDLDSSTVGTFLYAYAPFSKRDGGGITTGVIPSETS
jgi:hypothetical protein